MTTAQRLQNELGRGEAVMQFTNEAGIVINQLAPEFTYRSNDLWSFVNAAWPYDGEPADAAVEFMNAVEPNRADN